MLFGCLAGGLLRREPPLATKLQKLVLAGLLGLVLGRVLDETGLCPIVKRIWTPAWALSVPVG
jgi:predicted acyltransferase